MYASRPLAAAISNTCWIRSEAIRAVWRSTCTERKVYASLLPTPFAKLSYLLVQTVLKSMPTTLAQRLLRVGEYTCIIEVGILGGRRPRGVVGRKTY